MCVMAQSTQGDGAAEPVTISPVPVVGENPAAVPCLIPAFADAVRLVHAHYSCLVLDTRRRHVSLPPVYLRRKRHGISEQLSAELLKFSSSLQGVPLAFDDIKVVGHHGDIYDDHGFVHLNIQASFVVFKPVRGSKLVGVVNKLGLAHVGCLVHGCFNASVVKPSVLTLEQWRDSGLSVGQSLVFEVFQLDADAAGVTLIRGRLEKSRVQELVEKTKQNDVTLEQSAEPEEDAIESPKPKKKKDKRVVAPPVDELVELQETTVDMTEMDLNSNGQHTEKKKKKKKDKRVVAPPLDDSVELQDTTVDMTELDLNSNGRHKEKKKKKKEKQQDTPEISPSDLPNSDSSGYVSDKTSRKRAAESNDATEAIPAVKKKKKNK